MFTTCSKIVVRCWQLVRKSWTSYDVVRTVDNLFENPTTCANISQLVTTFHNLCEHFTMSEIFSRLVRSCHNLWAHFTTCANFSQRVLTFHDLRQHFTCAMVKVLFKFLPHMSHMNSIWQDMGMSHVTFHSVISHMNDDITHEWMNDIWQDMGMSHVKVLFKFLSQHIRRTHSYKISSLLNFLFEIVLKLILENFD